MMRTVRRNLLFIFADQMRGQDMRCAGNPDVITPTMDALALSGVLALNCFATTPVCTPNRAVLLSGRYGISNRTVANDLPMPTGMETIASVARDGGYQTGSIGKWHLHG